ncbi:hypothetical protein SAMN05216464_107160 [Mucilaginibacter pineti]|uniref:Uncharacterized protein n=1 Tax=Mucilaginibacter pineti TaxID=1391627 RepID=A0A1G7DXI8_9SPHI|nr:hypothetical protein [Mucilaginibacter pineti]SDE55775.1 hypothetical protein SAMN05216464_107160 [Mucilaginibacter pineti]
MMLYIRLLVKEDSAVDGRLQRSFNLSDYFSHHQDLFATIFYTLN